MPDHFSDRAIVLSRVPYQESDLVVGLLCRQGGPVSVLARSARSSRRRFQGLLDFFIVFDAEMSVGRGGMPGLSSAQPVRFFPGILDDLDRLEAGQALVQIARDILRDAPSSPTIFDSLEQAFGYLECAAAGLGHMAVLEWVLFVAAELGQVPAGGVCPGCGMSSGRFSVASDGRVLCAERCQGPGMGLLQWPSIYLSRRPLQDNPCLSRADWVPDPEISAGILSAVVTGITGFARTPDRGQDRDR